jgi:OmpA-OmpF porin, OOP family
MTYSLRLTTIHQGFAMKLAINIIVLGLALSLNACKKAPEKAAAPAAPAGVPAAAPTLAAPVATSPAAPATLKADLDWNTVPDLTNIGNFPFFTAPQGLKIENVKNGLSELFDFQKLENYTGTGIYTTEGKLGIMAFAGADGKDFNQRLFDKSIYDYIDKLGAKKIYQGDYPKNIDATESLRKKLGENMYSGKHGSNGLSSSSPFAVYAFKNQGKNYMVNIQSNSAQGTIYLMELEEFKQTIQKYSAEGMKKEIDATGKAIVNINFDTDKATLKADGQEVVNQITALLKGAPVLKLSIEGHTDNTGSAERNKVLSAERSNAVMLALVNTGISKDNLKAAGFGADKPLVANDSEENKAKNRRVELVKF